MFKPHDGHLHFEGGGYNGDVYYNSSVPIYIAQTLDGDFQQQ